MSQLLRDVISNNGLKIKLYVIDCPQHPIMNHFVKNSKYERDELTENLKSSKFLPYDLSRKRCDEIFYELENNLFIGYSCLLIVFNMDCKDRSNNLNIVIKRLKANKHLRYKSKIILTMLSYLKIPEKYIDRKVILSLTQLILSFYGYKPSKLREPTLTALDGTSYICSKEIRDTLPENTIYLHSFLNNDFDIPAITDWLLQQTYDTPLTSIQNIMAIASDYSNRIIRISSSSAIYSYSINPALAIIINQYHFTSQQQSREGSDQDVLRLVRELKVAAIPYILIENCNKQQLLEILNYLRIKDFWPLKKFLFFMMSHGDSAGNILTTDDKVHIMNDIVNVLQNSKSLKTCTQLICMVNCRGNIEPAYADFDDFDAITPTDNSSLRESTILLYSVPDQMKSVRSAQHGTPLIASFCKNFRTMSPNDCVKELINNVNKHFKDSKYYKCFPNNPVEFVCKVTAANQCIKPIPIGATNMIRLLQSTAIEMENILRSGNDSSVIVESVFYIAGNLCESQKKYFSPQLDNDRCELVEEFEKISVDELPQYIDNEVFKRKTYKPNF